MAVSDSGGASCEPRQKSEGWALLIDAKNAGVAPWYARYEAVPLEDTPPTLLKASGR